MRDRNVSVKVWERVLRQISVVGHVEYSSVFGYYSILLLEPSFVLLVPVSVPLFIRTKVNEKGLSYESVVTDIKFVIQRRIV